MRYTMDQNLNTRKGRLYKEYVNLLQQGQELTYIPKIGIVDIELNQFCLDQKQYLSTLIYFEADKKNSHLQYRKTKFIDKYKTQQIIDMINELKPKIINIELLTDQQRIQRAVNNQLNNYTKTIPKIIELVNKYKGTEHESHFYNMLVKAQNEIKQLSQYIA